MSKKNSRHRRRKPHFRRRTAPGAAPGTVVVEPGLPPAVMQIMAFGPAHFEERTNVRVNDVAAILGVHPVVWVNVDGVGDGPTIQSLGELFRLHALALEDVVNVHQRAKVEPYDDHLFVVARMVSWNGRLESEQVCFFIGPNYLLTFQQDVLGDCFDPVRQRLRQDHGKIRRGGSDYLAYALLDSVIDSYFPVVEQFADRLDQLDESLGSRQENGIIDEVRDVRNELLMLRRFLRPHRDCINSLTRDEHPLVSAETRLYLRDCYDHLAQLIELLEVYREMCADLREYHLSIVSNRMNEIMKVLTIIATIFIPLSFIAGLYGMNFDTSQPANMPELRWPYGYEFALGLMGATAAGMLGFFWRRGWIGRRAEPPPKDAGH